MVAILIFSSEMRNIKYADKMFKPSERVGAKKKKKITITM